MVTAPTATPKLFLKPGADYDITWLPEGITDNFGLAELPILLEYSAVSSDPNAVWTFITQGETNTPMYSWGTANDGSHTWTVPAVDSQDMRIRLRGVDQAGNITEPDAAAFSGTFTVDGTAPSTVAPQEPAGGATVSGKSAALTVAWDPAKVGDNFGLADLSLFYQAGAEQPFVLIQAGLSNSGSAGWAVGNIEPPLNSAEVRLKLAAVDQAGNTAESVGEAFTVDSLEPVVDAASLQFKDGVQGVRGGAAAEITWDPAGAQDNFGLAAQPIRLMARGLLPSAVLGADLSNSGSFVWQVPAGLDATGLVLELEARDRGGLLGLDAADFEFYVDSTVPGVTVTTAGKFNPETWPGAIEGTASDAFPGVRAELTVQRARDGKYFNGFAWQESEFFLFAKGGAEWRVEFQPEEDTYSIAARAVDAVGNQSGLVTSSFVYRAQVLPALSGYGLALALAALAVVGGAGRWRRRKGRA
jgi:hypothetical protein